jgi:CRP-like cAMP-binding protein
MVSPELLRRYPFFGVLNNEQLKSIAVIADEISVAAGTKLFEECQQADTFYLLIEGSVELSYKSEEEFHPKSTKVFSVGDINPEEVFGISSLVQPYEYNAAGTASKDSRILKINAVDLRKLLDEDTELGYILMHQVAKAIMERLSYTRVQLAAAWG